ncbi:hypothetical protein KFL_008800030 [Klebsormidium nitens]|uniref:UDENN domain-containing protein n=1 Tax=Klebsormidium nitens TaxID=105231 RepID=A0A1Y1IRN5_KLENI|nr:hypothetical protein KFL_008800030 [Klebsormidium nitens]|eukprot:GAQ91911.1 hypothetical protein KFL_008800030 [Klebsormidium nitens]
MKACVSERSNPKVFHCNPKKSFITFGIDCDGISAAVAMLRTSSLGTIRPDPSLWVDPPGLRRWLVAVAAFRFDLEQGQLLEACYPHGALSAEEELDIGFSCFPDSMATAHSRSSVHDCFFFFRLRRRGTPPQVAPAEAPRRASTGEFDRHISSKFTDVQPRSPVAIPSPRRGGTAEKGTWGSPSNRRHLQRGVSDLGTSSPAVGAMGGSGDLGMSPRESFLQSMPSLDSQRAAAASPGLRRTSFSGPLTPTPRQPSDPSSPIFLASPIEEQPTPGQHRRTATSDFPRSPSLAASGATPGKTGGAASAGRVRYLYGFVFNRQRQDERLRRGGEQKSVVLLSERPFTGVFRPMVQIAGPLYFDTGAKALEQVAAIISQWPPPQFGSPMDLPVGSAKLKAHLPPASALPPGCGFSPTDDAQSIPCLAGGKLVPHGPFPEADLWGLFRGVLLQLWLLWELLLIGEPLLLIAPTPAQCSEAAAALVNLIAPLPYSVDFRPYFTIHDPDFPALTQPGAAPKAHLLGVTNLFFLKALRTLPHVISVGTPPPTRAQLVTGPSPETGPAASRASPSRLRNMSTGLSPFRRLLGSGGNLLRAARQRAQGPISLMAEHKECVWTNYVPATKPDTVILNRLVDASASGPRAEESMAVVNNDMLWRHFVELTTNFLAPFGPYLRGATPSQGASPFVEPPPLPQFDSGVFLRGLAERGPGKFLSKRLKANWHDLYRRFVEGPNFQPWFQRRRAAAEHEQHRAWRAARAKADVRAFLGSMSEVEIVDAFTAVEKQLLLEVHAHSRSGARGTAPPAAAKLRADLRILYDALPRDMQQLLLFTPQRAALLQGGREPAKLPGRVSLSREDSTAGWSDTHSNRSTSTDIAGARASPVFSDVGSPRSSRLGSIPPLNLDRT